MYGADPDTISEGGSIASDMLGENSHTGLVGMHGGGGYGACQSAGGMSGGGPSSSLANGPR